MTRRLGVVLVAVLLSSALFLSTIEFDFVFLDDSLHVYKNPGVQEPTLENVARFWREPYMGLYIPVTYSLWAFQSKLAQTFGSVQASGNPDSRFFHATNVILQGLNTWLFYLLCVALGMSFGSSVFAALFFALHPLHVEAVAWVSGFKDLISGCFGLGALLVFLRPKATGRNNFGVHAAGLLLFAFSVLSKPSMVVLPLLAAILAIGILQRPWRRVALALAPWVLVALPIVMITPHLQGGKTELSALGVWERLRLIGPVLGFYAGKALLPTGPVLDYGLLPKNVTDSVALLGWGAITALLLWAVAAGRWAFSAALWFFVCLLPIAGLVPFDYGSFSLVADRYAFLSIGALAILAGRCFDLRYPLRAVGGAALLVLFAYGSWTYASHWKDTPTLFTHTLEKNPNSRLAHYNLAIYYAWKNQPSMAEAYFQGGIAQGTDWPDLHFHYAYLLARLDRYPAASVQYERGMKLLGRSTPELQCEFADLLAKAGQKGRAEVEATKATQLDPQVSCRDIM